MIHIATVHWLDETWVDIQLDFLERHLAADSYKVYACLNGIDPGKYQERIHYINTEPIVAHTTKLNLLGREICANASDDDIIYFIDGDAFPIGDIQEYVAEKLQSAPLVAIQRLENEGDPQPHPSFCATTVGFWQEIEGDWGQGPQWLRNDGKLRTDTGGLLWAKLNEKGISWPAMLRSNREDLHPLWFGVYHDLIYHHGAAFRTPFCMVDIHEAKTVWWKRWLIWIADSKIGTLGNGWIQNAIYSFVMKGRMQKTIMDSRNILASIQKDPEFYLRFTESKEKDEQGEDSSATTGGRIVR